MKKFLGFMALTMAMLVLPVVAKADTNFAVDCEKSCPTENGKCISACKITASGNTSNITSISVNIDFVADKGIVLKDFKVGDGWTKLSPTDETINVGSDKVQLSFVSSGVTSSNFEIASFNMELDDASVNCNAEVEINNVKTEIKDEKPSNPSTGAALPIAIIGCGAIGVGLIYTATKKNKKMYKI